MPPVSNKREDVIAACEKEGMRHHILSDGRLMEYSVNGPKDGVPVLNFHGGGMTANWFSWKAFLPLYDQLNVRMICPSLPGSGLSDKFPGATFADYANDSLAILEKEDVNGKFYMTAWSFHTPVLLHVLAKCPERVNAVLIQSGAVPLDAPGTSKFMRSMMKMMGGCLGKYMASMMSGKSILQVAPPDLKAGAKVLLVKDPDSYHFTNNEMQWRQSLRSNTAMLDQMKALGKLKSSDLVPMLKEVHVPALIVIDSEEVTQANGFPWLLAALPNTKELKLDASGFNHFYPCSAEIMGEQLDSMLKMG